MTAGRFIRRFVLPPGFSRSSQSANKTALKQRAHAEVAHALVSQKMRGKDLLPACAAAWLQSFLLVAAMDDFGNYGMPHGNFDELYRTDLDEVSSMHVFVWSFPCGGGVMCAFGMLGTRAVQVAIWRPQGHVSIVHRESFSRCTHTTPALARAAINHHSHITTSLSSHQTRKHTTHSMAWITRRTTWATVHPKAAGEAGSSLLRHRSW